MNQPDCQTCGGTGSVTTGTYSIGHVGPEGQEIELPEEGPCPDCPAMTDRETAEKILNDQTSGEEIRCGEDDLDISLELIHGIEQALAKARLEGRIGALEWANNSVYKEFGYELNSIYNELTQAKEDLTKLTPAEGE